MKSSFRLLHYFLFLVLLVGSLNTFAGNSFRLASGRLIISGMSKVEVLDLIGEPLSRQTRTQGLSVDGIATGRTIEIWSYLIMGSIGGEYYLTITLEDGVVTTIKAKQRGRI